MHDGRRIRKSLRSVFLGSRASSVNEPETSLSGRSVLNLCRGLGRPWWCPRREHDPVRSVDQNRFGAPTPILVDPLLVTQRGSRKTGKVRICRGVFRCQKETLPTLRGSCESSEMVGPASPAAVATSGVSLGGPRSGWEGSS